MIRIGLLGGWSEISSHADDATGVAWRKLDMPGIEKLTGAGVYYGAAQSEAIACSGEDVYIVGANSAGQAAMFSKYARDHAGAQRLLKKHVTVPDCSDFGSRQHHSTGAFQRSRSSR